MSSSDDSDRGKSSFWATTPGILSGIAAVIVAVTGLIAALHNPPSDGSNRGAQSGSGRTGTTIYTRAAEVALEAGIRKVYEETLDRTPQGWEVDVWKRNIHSGQQTLQTMRSAFTKDGQCRAAITKVYQQVLGRTPQDWEIGVWQDRIMKGETIASMRRDFEASDEGRNHAGH